MKTSLLICLACLSTLLCMAQTDITLDINHLINGNDFVTSPNGSNNLDQGFEADRLEYYLSRFSLNYDDDQTQPYNEVYALVDAFESNNTINLGELDAAIINSITFYIGVDEANNHGDPSAWPSTHALSPQLPSMHWGWASGYRFIALEGTTAVNSQSFGLHGLGDDNYFSVTIPLNIEVTDAELTISLDAHCDRILEDIQVSNAPIIHGDYGAAKVALENMRDYVFEFQGNTVGIDERYEDVSLSLFPNPSSSGKFTIELNGLPENTHIDIEIFDSIGKSVMFLNEENLNMNRGIELSQRGIYIVKVSENGFTMATKKIVIQ